MQVQITEGIFQRLPQGGLFFVRNDCIAIKEQYQVIYGGRTYSSNLSFSGNFNNGVPDGEWKFVESGNLNPEFEFRDNFNKDVFGNVYGMNLSSNGVPIEANRSRSVTVRFKKGRITYALNKRANTIELNVAKYRHFCRYKSRSNN